jgi:hypothetical protein
MMGGRIGRIGSTLSKELTGRVLCMRIGKNDHDTGRIAVCPDKVIVDAD